MDFLYSDIDTWFVNMLLGFIENEERRGEERRMIITFSLHTSI